MLLASPLFDVLMKKESSFYSCLVVADLGQVLFGQGEAQDKPRVVYLPSNYRLYPLV